MQINGFIWQHGGGIWDETKAPAGQAQGVVNSEASLKGFEHFLSLLKHMPPVVKTGTMDIFKVDELFREGKVAWIIQWIGFGESAITPETSKVADKVNFARMPGLKQADGSIRNWSNIGGQPFVLTTWNSDTVVKESIDFVKWWLSPEIQVKFAQAGGQSGLRSVHTAPDYASFRPWNHAFGPSLDWQKDVWHVPEFFELLVQQQEEFDKAITGQKSGKDALDAIAEFQQELLTESGRIRIDPRVKFCHDRGYHWGSRTPGLVCTQPVQLAPGAGVGGRGDPRFDLRPAPGDRLLGEPGGHRPGGAVHRGERLGPPSRALAGDPGPGAAGGHEHLSAPVVLRAQFLSLPGQSPGAAALRRALLLRKNTERSGGLGTAADHR
jgi:hypothetical protein